MNPGIDTTKIFIGNTGVTSGKIPRVAVRAITRKSLEEIVRRNSAGSPMGVPHEILQESDRIQETWKILAMESRKKIRISKDCRKKFKKNLRVVVGDIIPLSTKEGHFYRTELFYFSRMQEPDTDIYN